MRSRAKRLRTLARLVSLEEREARLKLGRANNELQRSEAQRSQLEAYAQEYDAQWLQAGKHGIEGHALRRFDSFRASLANTVDIQSQTVTLAREAGAQAAQQWRDARNRLRIHDELADRALREEHRAAERREQRRNDELAGNRRAGFEKND